MRPPLISNGCRRHLLAAALLASGLSPAAARAQDPQGFRIEPSLYVFLPGLSGVVGIGPIDVELGGASDAVIHLNFAAMGGVRASYGNWAVTAEVLYADLGATNGDFSGNVKEVIVEPTLSYAVTSWLEPLAGARYESLGGDVTGPNGRTPKVTRSWIDPIVGANLRLALGESVSLHFRGDVGGFGVGSKLTWQVFPYVKWRVARIVALTAGYRVLSIDYESGSGAERVHYDIVELGPQFGIAFPFDL